MKARVQLFVDVDGVLSIPRTEGATAEERGWRRWGDFYAAPIPMWQPLLALIDRQPHVDAHWLTCWGDSAHFWNEQAGTRRWPALHHLGAAAWPRRVLPDLFTGDPLDWKYVALRYRLRRYGHEHRPIVWIEDGFAPETRAWAEQAGWRLVDTTQEPVLSALRDGSPSVEAAQAFINEYLLPG